MVLPAYIDIIIQFYPPRAIQLHLFERLPNNIVWLSFRRLRRFYDGSLIDVALVIDVQLAKGILQTKDVLLLELRIFSSRHIVSQQCFGKGFTWAVQLQWCVGTAGG